MPRTPALPSVRPPEIHVEPRAIGGAQESARTGRYGEPSQAAPTSSERVDTGLRTAPGRHAAGSSEAARPASEAAWPAIYALAQFPEICATTIEPGVFDEWGSRQKVVIHDGRAYTVLRDPRDGTWQLVTPRTVENGPKIRRVEGGEWTIDDGSRVRSETGDEGLASRLRSRSSVSRAATVEALPEKVKNEITEILLKYPYSNVEELAATFRVSSAQVTGIASNVHEVVREWCEALRSRRYAPQERDVSERDIGRKFIDLPRWTYIRRQRREVTRKFIDRHQDRLSPASFTIMTHLPYDAFCTHVRLAGHTEAGPPLPKQGPLEPQAGPSGYQPPLTRQEWTIAKQRSLVVKLYERGRTPADIAGYLGTSREVVEACLAQDLAHTASRETVPH
jgi:hypothetical protein